jgi:hypothetical protein
MSTDMFLLELAIPNSKTFFFFGGSSLVIKPMVTRFHRCGGLLALPFLILFIGPRREMQKQLTLSNIFNLKLSVQLHSTIVPLSLVAPHQLVYQAIKQTIKQHDRTLLD